MALDKQRRTEKLDIEFSNAEISAIEEFKKDKQLPTLSAALRELLRRGLIASSSQPEISTEMESKNCPFLQGLKIARS